MDQRAVVSVEYLVILGLVMVLLGVVVTLMQNLYSVKVSLQKKIIEYRNKTISMF